VSLIMYYGKASWKPWMATVCLEITTALYATKRMHYWTFLEKEELTHRLWRLVYNLLRDPFYENVTKPQLLAVCDSWNETKPLSWIASFVRDYMPLWEHVYFYTSGS
jgi:peroxin-16